MKRQGGSQRTYSVGPLKQEFLNIFISAPNRHFQCVRGTQPIQHNGILSFNQFEFSWVFCALSGCDLTWCHLRSSTKDRPWATTSDLSATSYPKWHFIPGNELCVMNSSGGSESVGLPPGPMEPVGWEGWIGAESAKEGRKMTCQTRGAAARNIHSFSLGNGKNIFTATFSIIRVSSCLICNVTEHWLKHFVQCIIQMYTLYLQHAQYKTDQAQLFVVQVSNSAKSTPW